MYGFWLFVEAVYRFFRPKRSVLLLLYTDMRPVRYKGEYAILNCGCRFSLISQSRKFCMAHQIIIKVAA